MDARARGSGGDRGRCGGVIMARGPGWRVGPTPHWCENVQECVLATLAAPSGVARQVPCATTDAGRAVGDHHGPAGSGGVVARPQAAPGGPGWPPGDPPPDAACGGRVDRAGQGTGGGGGRESGGDCGPGVSDLLFRRRDSWVGGADDRAAQGQPGGLAGDDGATPRALQG
jgi:hypothetical protein